MIVFYRDMPIRVKRHQMRPDLMQLIDPETNGQTVYSFEDYDSNPHRCYQRHVIYIDQMRKLLA